MDEFPVDFDVISGARLKMKIRARFAVHHHAAGGDQLIRAATGYETSRGDETIQTHLLFVEALNIKPGRFTPSSLQFFKDAN